MLSFEPTEIRLRIQQVDESDLIGESIPMVQVKFTSTKLFKSVKSQAEVRLGTNLHYPLLVSLSDSQNSTFESIQATLSAILITMLVFSIPMILTGSLIPVYIFINSVQLVTLLPLMTTFLPSLVRMTLLDLLSKIKLDWLVSSILAKDIKQAVSDYRLLGQKSLTILADESGYNETYVTFLVWPVVLGIGVAILITLYTERRKTGRENAKGKVRVISVMNFVLRLFLLLSTQVFVCMAMAYLEEDADYWPNQVGSTVILISVLALITL